MKITSTTTLHLDKELTQRVIAEYCEAEGFKVKPEDVKFEINSYIKGYRLGEYAATEFEGCTVSVNEEREEDI